MSARSDLRLAVPVNTRISFSEIAAMRLCGLTTKRTKLASNKKIDYLGFRSMRQCSLYLSKYRIYERHIHYQFYIAILSGKNKALGY